MWSNGSFWINQIAVHALTIDHNAPKNVGIQRASFDPP